MFNNPNIPVFFEIDELENYIKSLPSNENKLEYLKDLYYEYIIVCYRLLDRHVGNYIKSKKLEQKYYPIAYIPGTDKYQTHISMSKYIKFLRIIDEKLLPFVRNEIKKLDKSFKEDHSQMIKDYPVFNFNKEKIFKYIDTLTTDKLNYIYAIIRHRTDYFIELYPINKTHLELVKLLNEDDLYNELKELQYTIERFPERINEKGIVNIDTEKDEPELFKNDKSLCGFNLKGIKEHAKKFKNTQDAILYLMRVRKEALQNRDLIPDKNINHSFFTNLDYELGFYKEKQKMENEALSKKSLTVTKSTENKMDPIRLHWQGDDTLIPYLMKRLFDEGFINNADFELRKDFIEQSFYKKSGKIFTAKEVSAVESNTKSNRKSNYKPSKAHKVERVIEDLKSKRDELTQKKTFRTKKK